MEPDPETTKNNVGDDENQSCTQENEEVFGGPKFHPPLYRQRYIEVISVLEKHAVSRVADFGCAECWFIARLRENQAMQEIYGIDIDRYMLESNSFKIQPRPTDFLTLRDVQLKCYIYAGSVVDYDARLKNIDAITMIEVIEHLEDDILKAFPTNVFGQLQPRLVVLTTPNIEFNVLFPNCTGFRHYDHKFEWTRQQFKNWCEEICQQYPYEVELSGIGDPPEGSEHVGHCSQMAVFTRIKEKRDLTTFNENDMPYELIAESVFKEKPKLSREEETLQEAQYYMHMLLYMHKQEEEEGEVDSQESTRDSGYPDTSSQACLSATDEGAVSASQTRVAVPDLCHERTSHLFTEGQDSQGQQETENDGQYSSRSISSPNGNTKCQRDSKITNDELQNDLADSEKDECAHSGQDLSSQVAADVGEDEDVISSQPPDHPEGKVSLPLSQLFQFQKLKSLCKDIEFLRDVLEKAGYEFSDDKCCVLCDKYPDSSIDDDDEEEEEFDDNDSYPDEVKTFHESEEETWSTDEEAEGFTASSATMKTAAKISDYVCQICYKTMDRLNLKNRHLSRSMRILCTYCYSNHCLDCHLVKYKDTQSYEEGYAEWTPYQVYPREGAIKQLRLNDTWFDRFMPDAGYKINLSVEDYQQKLAANNKKKHSSIYKETKNCEETLNDWMPAEGFSKASVITIQLSESKWDLINNNNNS